MKWLKFIQVPAKVLTGITGLLMGYSTLPILFEHLSPFTKAGDLTTRYAPWAYNILGQLALAAFLLGPFAAIGWLRAGKRGVYWSGGAFAAAWILIAVSRLSGHPAAPSFLDFALSFWFCWGAFTLAAATVSPSWLGKDLEREDE